MSAMHGTPRPPIRNEWFSIARVGAIVLRHVYLLRSSWARWLEMIYWPVMQMLLWGLITVYLAQHSSLLVQATGLLLAGVLLWDVLFRSQLGVGISFLEEIWSRNLGHLMVSPLRPQEFVVGLVLMSLIRTLIGVVPAAALAIFLYNYSIFDMGLPLLAFFVNLSVLGWSIGLVINGIILRHGLGAESLAWMAMFALAPISGIYYPISVLPEWAQIIAWGIPASHVFEGMRALLLEKTFRFDLLWTAAALNIVYLVVGIGVYLLFFRSARRRGLILQIGE